MLGGVSGRVSEDVPGDGPVSGSESDLPVVVIAGPTASGKSAIALDLAARTGGEILNADSMQVYADLRILTARPDDADLAAAPHHLYGYLSGDERCSAGRWRADAVAAIRSVAAKGALPIVVGGTGLYLRALMTGLSRMPAVPADIRAAAMAEQARIGNPGFHAALATRDPEMAARLNPNDTQRLIRAWEVLEATGRSLAKWQAAPPDGAPDGFRFTTLLVAPEREALYDACNRRFETMIDSGALEEIAALAACDLDPDLPVMKALGVRPLLRHLAGEMPLDEAVAAGQRETRRYAKRQTTWFRHQMRPDRVWALKYSESLTPEICSFISDFRLTPPN